MFYSIINGAVAIFLFGFSYTLYAREEKAAHKEKKLLFAFDFFLLALTFALLALSLSHILPLQLNAFVNHLIVFFDACLLCAFSFSFFRNKENSRAYVFFILLESLLLVFAFFIVFVHFSNIQINSEQGIAIDSGFLFSGNARNFFSWNWANLYPVLFRFIVPFFACLTMLLKTEYESTHLELYQSQLRFFLLLVLWTFFIFFAVVSRFKSSAQLFYLFSYALVFFASLHIERIRYPLAKRDMRLAILQKVISYFAVVLVFAVFYLVFSSLYFSHKFIFAALLFFSELGAFFAVQKITQLKKLSRLTNTEEFENRIAHDFGLLDYSGEMDEVTNAIFRIFRTHVECSSMSAYIDDGKGSFITAFSSEQFNDSIPRNNAGFLEIIESGKNIASFTEIAEGDYSPTSEFNMMSLFEITDSDIIVLLSEANVVFGFIAFGKKINGDHYSLEDVKLFEKLYPYFFVSGYYMRNITHKDVIGIVNREIRMSSQIINSIQQELDIPKHPKADTAYKMVASQMIGGDFVDMIRINDNSHLFMIGSLSGKGIAASMNMVILKSIARTFLEQTHDFKLLVQKLNNFIRDDLPKSTVFFGAFMLADFKNNVLYYINCGIPAIFLYSHEYNNVIEIQGRGHVLGFVENLGDFISVQKMQLHAGDIVFACTNGLVSAKSLRGEAFGKDNISRSLLSNTNFTAQKIADFAYDSFIEFLSTEMKDDISMFVLKYNGV